MNKQHTYTIRALSNHTFAAYDKTGELVAVTVILPTDDQENLRRLIEEVTMESEALRWARILDAWFQKDKHTEDEPMNETGHS